MPSISLTDSSSVTVDAALFDASVIGKTPQSVLSFARNDVINVLNQTLDQVQIKSTALAFAYAPELTFDGGTATFTAGGGPGGELDLMKPADALFPKDQFGTKIGMNGNYYLALAFDLAACATPAGTPGAFTLTLNVTAKATAKLYMPFGKTAAGAFPTLKASLETLLSSYKLPTQIEDFAPWPVGTVFTFDCQGALSFSGSVNLLTAINPTASPTFSNTTGPITVTAGPSLTVTGGFKLIGEFQARIWKRDNNTLQLGYFKKAGQTLTVSFDGAVGADAEIGSFDLVAQLYGLLGNHGKLDGAWLKQNVPQNEADNVSSIFKTAVAKKLAIELNAEADTTLTDQAAFSWNFNIATAASVAQQILTDALKGKLDPLLGGGKLPEGVTAAGSILDHIRENKRTLTLNFLGLYDYASVNDAVIDLQTKTTEDGQLILTDTAHLKRLLADATPFIKSDRLRQVLVEDGTATVSYAALFGKVAPKLTVSYTYFNYKSHARVADLASFLSIASTVAGKDASGPWQTVINAQTGSQNAYINAVLTFDVPAATALFLDPNGNPRPESDFAAILRKTILVMPPETAFDPHFLAAVRNEQTWHNLLNAGTEDNMYGVLGVSITAPPTWARFATSWISAVGVWSPRMHAAGQALQAVTAYLAQHPGDDLKNDNQFQTLRKSFAGRLATAIQGAPVFPDDASGLLILFNASKPSSEAVTIAYAGKIVKDPIV